MFKLLDTYHSDSLDYSDVSSIINVNSLHEKNYLGNGIKVAVVDTGCSNHSLLQNKIIGGKNFTNEGNADDFNDFNGHGTHVAGIIGAAKNEYFTSIAPKCDLLICKALNKNGEGLLENIVKAIDYAINQKVDIINLSLGCNENLEELHNVIKKAINNNISVVCASGNSGDGNENTEESDFPGAYEEVIEVGAISKDLTVSKFSNVNKYVDLVAPGENIISTYLDDKFINLTGTSMAAPIVSGALALLIEWSTNEFNRRLSEMELYGTLIKNTKSISSKKSSQGHGYLYLNIDN